ncbi:MAG: LPS-assembly protein LptD, partial [Leptospiraceae bacterium]|nr:LPS-assembly protein LptD [Leptospiraceae bacterium]
MPGRTALSAQEEREDADALLRRLRQIQSNPVLRRLFEDREDLTPAQKRIISQAVDAMSPEEVDENLTLMELSTDGSIYTRRERLKIALGVGTTPSLPPSPLPPEIAIENASEGEYIEGSDDQRGLLKLSGRIRVRLPNGVFYADRVIVDTARQEIYGEGDIVYLENDTEVRAERIIYNRKLNIGIVYNTEGQVGPIHFIGRTIKQVDEDHFAVSQAFFHTCSAETPHYNFTASKLYIYDDNRIFATGVWYHIGGVPMLPLPFLFASDWGTGIITQVGYSDVQGWFMENTYQFGVPDAIYSSWQPMAYRFKFDYHQKIGEMLGIEMYRFAPGLSYVFDIGGARYKRYEVVGDYREKDRIAITNNVLRDDGTTGRIEDNWHKIFALINFRQQDLTDNNVRNVQLRFEDYGHFLYEYEFGGRYVPESTIPALYKNSEAGRGLLRTNTNWNLVYNEVRDDLRIRVSATRNRYWDVNVDFFEDSEYVPQNDVAPSIDIEKRWRVGDVPYLDLPVYWDHTLHSDLQREYSLGKDFKNINNNKYQTGLRTYIPIIPYVSLAPTIGYGLQKSVPQLDTTDASQEEALITEG